MIKATSIDALLLSRFHYLTEGDRCCFLHEYTVGGSWEFSKSNQLVLNLKKSPLVRGTNQWRHKEAAIKQCAREFRGNLNSEWLQVATLIPMPPSKAKEDPEYDDRMLRVLQTMGDFDVRELLIQRESTEASHLGSTRRSPTELQTVYRIDERLTGPAPATIGIFDDVITTGSHFRAAKDLLSERFPGIDIYGIFWARSVWPEDS